MLNALHSDRSPIVIDIHEDHVVAIQLQRRNRKWEQAASVVVRRKLASDGASAAMSALSEDEIAAIERGLARQGVMGRSVVLMSPSSATVVELLELPPRGPETPIDALAGAEIARLARWDDSTPFQLCTWDVPGPIRRPGSEAAVGTSLYAAALPESAVDGMLQLAWRQGWSVERIVPAPIAAAAVVSELLSPSKESISVVVDLRWDRAAITVVRGGVAIYHRGLPDNGLALLSRGIVADLRLTPVDAATAIELGTFGVRDAASRAFAVCESFAEALATELEASLAFAARRYGDLHSGRLLLVGPGSRIPGLDDWLAERLEIESDGAALCAAAPVSALAMPTAVAKLSAHTSADRRLLPEAQQDLIRREWVAHRWLAAAAAVLIVAFLGTSALYLSAFANGEPLAARVAGLQRDQSRADAEAADAKRKLTELLAITNFEERVRGQPDYSALLQVLSGALDPAAVLREVALTEPTGSRAPAASGITPLRRLKLIGIAPTAAVLNNQVSSLRSLDIFDRVELARTSRNSNGEGVSFELTMDVVARTSMGGAK